MFLPYDETNGFNNQRGLKGPFHNYCLPLTRRGRVGAGRVWMTVGEWSGTYAIYINVQRGGIKVHVR